MKTLLLFIAIATVAFPIILGEVNVTQPITASDYASILKQGFATNYFKVLPPGRKYRTQNIQDIADRGFSNLRLRSRADLYTAPYESSPDFQDFLTKLEEVVDECLAKDVNPVISWIHHHAEAFASDTDKTNYIEWWTLVAEKLKDKNYRLSFNLFTELGVDSCGDNCDESLRKNTTKYNDWTKAVVSAIRQSGGNNANRVIILASPKKDATGLIKIDQSIYHNDTYMMAEFHLYASGPNHYVGNPKEWRDDGNVVGKGNVLAAIEPAAADWTVDTGIPLYFGAWMAEDMKNMALSEYEIKKFSRYFVLTLKGANPRGIPWSLNVLDRYYDTEQSTWITEPQVILTNTTAVDVETILNTIVNNM